MLYILLLFVCDTFAKSKKEKLFYDTFLLSALITFDCTLSTVSCVLMNFLGFRYNYKQKLDILACFYFILTTAIINIAIH